MRIGLLGVFAVVAFSSDDGREPLSTACYAAAAGSDYLDGMLARVTGQYSRLGALMDPLIDRLVVIAGVAVVWHFELLPRWALAVLLAREVVMLVAGRGRPAPGPRPHINWLGRIAVWPTMGAVGAGAVRLGRGSTRRSCTSASPGSDRERALRAGRPARAATRETLRARPARRPDACSA